MTGAEFTQPPPSVTYGRLAILPGTVPPKEPTFGTSSYKILLGQKVTAVGSAVATGAVTAGTYVYEKGKIAADMAAKKGKEIAVYNARKQSYIGESYC